MAAAGQRGAPGRGEAPAEGGLPPPAPRPAPELPEAAPAGGGPSRRERRRQRTTMNVEHEINLLVEEIRRLGTKNADGQVSVKFGVLFADEKCANLFEALVGTLKAAKRRKIVTYQGELLLQGVHDNVDITLLQD